MIEDENGVYIRGWRLGIEESVGFLEAVSPCMPANVQVIAGISSAVLPIFRRLLRLAVFAWFL
jgi:hypothetical protein